MNRRLFGLFLVGYQLLWCLVLLVTLPLLPLLMLIRKRRRTLFQRLGFQSLPQAGDEAHRPIWIHTLSVGELISAHVIARPHPELLSQFGIA